MTGYAKEAWLNDLDTAIHAFWHSALNDADALIEKVQTVTLTIPEWRRQRQIYLDPHKHDTLTLGFATLFLNRVNRSGILGGGVIGGLDQTGEWLIDARFNREGLVERIRRVAHHQHRIRLFNLDAEKFLREKKFPRQSLVYLDPPYFRKAQRLYRNHYAEADHERIAKLVQSKLKANWIVSYDDAPEIAELYPDRRCIRYALYYSAQTKRNGSELMFFSDNIQYPNTNNPALYQSEG